MKKSSSQRNFQRNPSQKSHNGSNQFQNLSFSSNNPLRLLDLLHQLHMNFIELVKC